MSPNDLDWSAAWSAEVERLWHKFTLRGELDPHYPPATVRKAYNQEAYNQMVAEQAPFGLLEGGGAAHPKRKALSPIV